MADTITVAKGFTKPAIGSHDSSWGDVANTNFDLIDAAIGPAFAKLGGGSAALGNDVAVNLGGVKNALEDGRSPQHVMVKL